MDGIDRDHFPLNTRRNRRFFFSAEHYPVVKVRPHRGGASRRSTAMAARRPAIRWSVTFARKGTDQRLEQGTADAVPSGISLLSRVIPRSSIRDGSVGGDEETRTPDPLLAKEMLCQLSYVPAPGRVMVGVSGLEPETSALSGQCSNQLS